MKPKTMILMVVAVGCGLVASYMTSRLIAERNGAGEQKPMAKVLVAKKKLKALTPLTKPEDLLVEKEIPADLVPKKAITSFDNLKDKRVNKIINEEQFLTQDDLVTKETATLDYELPPGYRAVGMQVNPVSLVGGFVLPRSRVDVVAVTREGETEAKIILQDMLVLAVDMASERDLEKGKGMLGATVTLAALPEEASRLALASSMGELRLLLRGQQDHEKLTLKATKRVDLGKPLATPDTPEGEGQEGQGSTSSAKIPDLPEVAPPAQAAAPPVEQQAPVVVEEAPVKTHTMKLVLGDNVQEVKFIQEKDGTWTKGSSRTELDDQPKERAKPQRGFVPAKPKEPEAPPAAPAPAKKPESTQEKLQKNSGLPPVGGDGSK